MTLILFVLMAWAPGAMASPHHHNGEQVSPFDKKQGAPSAHCILKSHTHFGFCPHSLPSKDKTAEFLIAADCGGKTPGTLPSHSSASKNLTVWFETPATPVFIVVGNMKNILSSYDFHLFDLLDPPPRFS